MKKALTIGTMAAAMGGLFSASAVAAVSVYEGFAYPTDSVLNGQSGGEGFTGPWDDLSSGDINTISGTGLTYGALQTAGGSLLLGSPGGDEIQRSFTPIPAVNGNTEWIGFLLRFDEAKGPLNTGIAISLTVGGALGSGDAPRIGVFTNEENENVFGVTHWYGDPVFSTVPFLEGVTYLVVTSIEWNTTGTETLSLFINPDLGSIPTSPVLTRDDIDIETNQLQSLTVFGWDVIPGWYMDEIRIGSSFSDIVPIPEPVTGLLVLVGLTAIGFRRRR